MRVKLGKNTVKIGAAARGGVGDEVEIRGFKKNGGILMLLRETAGFLVGDGENFMLAVESGGNFGARGVGQGNAVKISASFENFGVGGAKGFAARKNIESLEH